MAEQTYTIRCATVSFRNSVNWHVTRQVGEFQVQAIGFVHASELARDILTSAAEDRETVECSFAILDSRLRYASFTDGTLHRQED